MASKKQLTENHKQDYSDVVEQGNISQNIAYIFSLCYYKYKRRKKNKQGNNNQKASKFNKCTNPNQLAKNNEQQVDSDPAKQGDIALPSSTSLVML